MPRFRCPDCCCGPAIVLHPPRGATPICSRCGGVLERQPLIRPVPMLVFLAVTTAFIGLSFPVLFVPRPEPRRRPLIPASPTAELDARHREIVPVA